MSDQDAPKTPDEVIMPDDSAPDPESSWILDLRRRLADPPPRVLVRPGGNGHGEAAAGGAPEGGAEGATGMEPKRAAALVPLYVDAGQLWTILTEREQRVAGHLSPPAFPGALVGKGEDGKPEEPWQAALRGGRREAGLYPRAALELGRLDEAATPAGVVIVPCVAALPEAALKKREEPAEGSGVTDVVPIPITALARPRLVEERPVRVGDREEEIVILHVGKRRIWGVTATLILNLLSRLGLGGSPAG